MIRILLAMLLLSTQAVGDDLLEAVRRGDISRVRVILGETKDGTGFKDAHGWSPLHFAALNGDLDLARLLLSVGAEVDGRDGVGLTPLDIAALKGHHGMVEFLISRGARILPKEDIVETVPGTLPRLGLHPELKSLLEDLGIGPASSGISRMIHAVMEVREDLQRNMNQRGIGPRDRETEAPNDLFQAIEKADLKEVMRRVEKNPRTVFHRDRYGIGALHLAAVLGRIDLLRFLLDRGVSVDQTTKTGITPLYGASSEGRADTVAYLIQRGADVQARTVDGAVPLHSASTAAVAELLVRHGADVMTKNLHGYTPLHIAANYGHADVARFLIRSGARINEPNHYGWTPLMEAVYGRHLDIVRILLQKGADVNARSDGGSTALKVAVILGREDIAAVLIRSGGRE